MLTQHRSTVNDTFSVGRFVAGMGYIILVLGLHKKPFALFV